MEITLRDLQDMRAGITTDMRHELTRVEKSISVRLDGLERKSDSHTEKIGAQNVVIAELKASVADGRGGVLDLSKRQRKVLYTAAVTFMAGSLDGLKHLLVTAFSWFAAVSHGGGGLR